MACQIRMARAALGLSLHQLGDLSGVSEKTIRRCESAQGIPSVARETMSRLRKVFEDNGCTFERDEGLKWARVTIDQGALCLVKQYFPSDDGEPQPTQEPQRKPRS